ncbi:transcriptional regulator [Aureimonas sp. Leaf454]|uniref:helix-turn-helix domain-containing protein n=1 Tax=Aureimonas sp. Leaf454 TaxID=1736381 RepID=UPI0007019412|nr:helix-turn-helix transcriptional regulator [Aureimonas sp. Leaf454]KQT47588.1 transcriptional regulator [Aureimonas sp. Leaf454]
MILTPEQCRAARGLLDWTQEQLAQEAGVSRSTVRDFEKLRHHLNRASEQHLIEAFARAGVVLIPMDAGGLGVRLVPSCQL